MIPMSMEEGVCHAIAKRTGEDGTKLYLEGLNPFAPDPYRNEPFGSFERWLDASGYRVEWDAAADQANLIAIIERWNAEQEQPSLFAEVAA